jgi:hypothetical protein
MRGMKKYHQGRRLVIGKETVRQLAQQEIVAVAGGRPASQPGPCVSMEGNSACCTLVEPSCRCTYIC